MRYSYAAPIALLALAGCTLTSAPPPQITINPTTNTATVATPNPTPTGGPLDQISAALANTYSKDDAGAVNLACGAPVADQIGCAFFTDLANLTNSLPPNSTTDSVGALMLVERARLKLVGASNLLQSKQLAQTLVDGYMFVQDTKAKGLAVPAQVMQLLQTIQGQLLPVGIP